MPLHVQRARSAGLIHNALVADPPGAGRCVAGHLPYGRGSTGSALARRCSDPLAGQRAHDTFHTAWSIAGPDKARISADRRGRVAWTASSVMGADLDVLCGPAEGGVAQLAGRSVGAGYPARPLGYFVAEADVPAHRCPPGGWLV